MSMNKTGIHRRKYDAAFKEEVIKMVFNGRPIREVAESLGIGQNLIHKWKSRSIESSKPGQQSANAGGLQHVSAADYERIRVRLREVEQERDILKKALGIFSRGN
jgi:transposase